MSFNASVEVTEIVLKTVENVSKELAKRCILECALRHNFNADEELRILGLDSVTVISKKREQKQKAKFCLPFLAHTVDKNGCNGIAFNEGLYTQCKKVRVNDVFCKTCLGESLKSNNGEPKNGTVRRRSFSPYYSYEDSRGRMPPSYQDYMKKKGITEAEVLKEAEKQGIKIPREHFMSFTRSAKKVKEKSKKKSKKCIVIENDEEKADLFAELSSDDMDLNDKETLKSGEENMLEEKNAQKAQEKADREEKAEREKAEKAAKAAQRALEKAERDAKAEQEKAAKAAQRAQEKAERDAKAEQEKAEKAAKAALKAQEKADRTAKVENEQEKKVAETPVENTKVTVKRIFHNGTQYLKSSKNVLYSPETKEEVGLWCEETQSVLALPDDYYETDDEDEN
jgi:chemotaxis protein histidine kinase CheA